MPLHYKADMVVCSGTNSEILEKLRNPEFANFLCITYGELLSMIEDM